MKKIISALLVLTSVLSMSSCGFVQKGDPADSTEFVSDKNGNFETQTSGKSDDTPKEIRISFAAAGDNLIHESVYKDAAVRAAALASSGAEVEDYYFTEMYSERFRSIVSSADLAFVNQEAPMVADRPASGYPAFNTPTEAGETLVEMGFDIVNLANNHMLDMEGICEGLRGTMDYWNTTGVMTVGAYENEADYNQIRVMQCKGKKIAVLSYTYGTNGNRLNPNSPDLVIPYINDSDIIDQVSRARDNADAVIVSMHWGDENTFEPNAEQKRLAKLLSKYGADVVIGHHSHTLQPMEWVTNDMGDKTLVIYSLGNLISSQMKAKNMVGGLATFELVFSPEGVLSVENAVLNPTMTHYSADGENLDNQGLPTRTNVSVGLLEDYTSDMCADHGAQLPALNGVFDMDTLMGYVTNTVPSEFLTDYFK